jgi:Transposase DDE domain group 1
LVDLLRDAQAAVAAPIILDLDAPGDPLQGHQEERFFHGDYDNYCYRPLDVFCGRVFCGRHLLAAKLRPANIHARTGRVEEVSRIVTPIRRRGPAVGILLRAEAGFARDGLMSWCENRRENNGADFLFGLARNRRLVGAIEAALAAAQEQSQKTGKPARRFQDFTWRRDSGSRERRVVAKAEWTQGAANPRFVHLAEPRGARGPPPLREALLHPRREGKLHQKKPARSLCRSHLGPDNARQPVAVILCRDGLGAGLCRAPHRLGSHQFAKASCGTIRLKLRKIGALVRTSVRRVKLAMPCAFPSQAAYCAAHAALTAAATA